MSSQKINVEIRIKPSTQNSIETTDTSLTIGTKTYHFHKIHLTTTQNQLFEGTKQLFDNFINGFNCTIIAYGQTGSGKTYTMGINHEDSTGIVPQALHYLFNQNIKLTCTFIEIYNEDVIDLLSDHKVPLSLRELNGDISIAGVTEMSIDTVQEGLDILHKGCMERTTKSTKMNLQSSRSHAIFTLFFTKNMNNKTSISKFSFVDLAGSERLKRTMCIGDRAKESISINSGLLSLGNVISALYKKQSHIPFRDSKLTRILQSCLNGYILMIACISSNHSDINETHNTLKYANRAASITTYQRKIEIDNSKFNIINLRKEIQKLKNENHILKERMSKCNNINIESIIKENRALKNRLESVEYIKGLKEKSEDLAQEVVKHPFVQNLINENSRLLKELSNYTNNDFKELKNETDIKREDNIIKDVKIIFENKKENTIKIQNNKEKNSCFSYDLNSSKDKDKINLNEQENFSFEKNKNILSEEKFDKEIQNLSVKKIEDNLSFKEQIIKEKEIDQNVYSFKNGIKNEQTFNNKKIRVSPDIKFENPLTNIHQTNVNKKVTFDIPIKKKNSLWTPRKEKIKLNIKLIDKQNSFPPQAMCLSNSSLIFSSNDNIIRKWTTNGIEPLFTDFNVKCFEPSDVLFYTTRMILKQFDSRSGIRPIQAYKNEVSCLKKHNYLIYTGHENGTLSCLDIRNNKVIYEKVHNGTIFSIEIIDDIVYTGSRDHSIKALKNNQINTLDPPHYDSISKLINYKNELVSVSRDCSLKRWNNSNIVKTVPNAHTTWIRSADVMDHCFVTGSVKGTLRFWDFCDNSVFCVGRYESHCKINFVNSIGKYVYVGGQREILLIESDYKT